MRLLTTLLTFTVLVLCHHFSAGQQSIDSAKTLMKFQRQIDTTDMKRNKKELQEQIEQATNTIGFLNSNITAIGIFLGVYLLVLGLAVYVLGIKPSQDAIDRLEKNMDTRISAYLENDRVKRIDVAIDSLDSDKELQRTMSLQFLAGQSIAQPLTDVQYMKIFGLAKTSRHDDIRLGATSLLFRIDQNSLIYSLLDEYFMQVMNGEYTLNEDKSTLSTIVRQHLSKVPMSNQKTLKIQELAMEHSDQPYYLIHNIFDLYKSKEFFLLFSNSPSIVRSFFKQTDRYDIIELVKRDGESSINILREKFLKLGGTQMEFDQTLLVQSIRKHIENRQ
jgi:hypothetical protein